MQFQCPKCSGVVSIDEANLGKTVSCGHCKEIVSAPESRFAPGVIINDFIIEKEVGVGGMGVVYLARQITLDRHVALKILKEKYAQDAEFIVQFVREARSAAKLNHPNIVQAYAVGEENGIFFFAMEFVDGDTMKDILAKERKIDPQRAAKIIRDIAIALDYAWTESKIVHHDIKPDNIMLTKNGKAKLADLGLASMFGDAEVDDSGDEVLGTPQYISPEQLLGDPTDVRSDIYSLGATFYHLVTGTFPYNGDTPTAIAHQHVNGVFQPPIEREPSVPQTVSDIISKMMAKDINQRYQSAEDLASDIKKYLDNSGFVSTASVPIQQPATVENKPPAAQKVTPPTGGMKLSFGGGKFPPAPAPAKTSASSAPAPAAAPKTAAKSEPVKSPAAPQKTASVSTPKVNLGGAKTASVNTPKVNLGGAKSTAANAPKVNLSGTKTPSVSTPKVNLGGTAKNVPQVNLNKSASPSAAPAAADATAPATAPAAPQLGLKKDEPPAPKASPAPEKTPETTEKKEDSKPPKAEKAKKENKAGTKKKKAKAVDEKKTLPAWLIIIIVLIIGCGGGITFYLYKNKWKAPVIDKIKTWNAERKEAAKNIVRRVPPVQRKELSVEEKRKEYVPAIQTLIKFYKDNPSKGKDFMKKVENFIADEGIPELENEKTPFAELIELYNTADEKVYMTPGRSARRRNHEAEIRKRIADRNAIIQKEKQLEAERVAAEKRRIAEQKAAEERARREQEAQRALQQQLDQYRTKIAPAYPMLAKMFYDAIFSKEKETEFNNKVNGGLFNEYLPDGVQMQIYNEVDAYGKRLQKEIMPARRIYQRMTENTERFIGHQFGLRGNMVEIVSVNFPKREVRVRSLSNRKIFRLSLNDEENLNKIVELLEKKLPREKNDIKKFPFYYKLFFGDKNAARSMTPPSPVWKEFFRYYR